MEAALARAEEQDFGPDLSVLGGLFHDLLGPEIRPVIQS
jgi:hypothetical protein